MINRNAFALSLVLVQAALLVTQASAVNWSDPAALPFRNETSLDRSVHRSLGKVSEYLTLKYKTTINVAGDVKVTRDGPSGDLHVTGDMAPQKKIDHTGGDKVSCARAIAKAFMEDEKDLLGIRDLNEMVESSAQPSPTGEAVLLHYRRMIDGIEVKGATLDLAVSPSATIFQIVTNFVPVPPQAYEAAKQKLCLRMKYFPSSKRICVASTLTGSFRSSTDI